MRRTREGLVRNLQTPSQGVGQGRAMQGEEPRSECQVWDSWSPGSLGRVI